MAATRLLVLLLLAGLALPALASEAAASPGGHCGLYGWRYTPVDVDCTTNGYDHCDVWARGVIDDVCLPLS